jgi:hypothetical protein
MRPETEGTVKALRNEEWSTAVSSGPRARHVHEDKAAEPRSGKL